MIRKLAAAIPKNASLTFGAVMAVIGVLQTVDDALPIAVAYLERRGHQKLADKITSYVKYPFPLFLPKKKLYGTIMRTLNERERQELIKEIRDAFPRDYNVALRNARGMMREMARGVGETARKSHELRERARRIDPFNPLFMGSFDADE